MAVTPAPVRALAPVMRTLATVAAAVGMLALAACQAPGSTSGCKNVMIDWVDFVKVGSTQYVAGTGPEATLSEGDLGAVFAHVKFKVDGNVCDPSYQPKDGDAAFLDPGTPIYAVKGYVTSELLAAKRNGEIVAYRAFRG